MSKTKTTTKEEVTPTKESTFISRLTTDEKIGYACLLLTIIMVYIVRSNFLTISFERDEGAYSYYGKMLLDGKIPYKDFYEQKFPGVFYFYAFIVFIFGSTVAELHSAFIYLNIATVIILFFAAKKIFNPIAAAITIFTYALASMTPMISGFTIQSEHGVAFFASLGLLFYALNHETKKWFYFLAMGLAMGAAFMTKTSGVLMALWGGFILLIDFAFEKDRKIKSIITSLGWYAVGGFSVIGILFFLIYLKGSFNEMLYWTLDMPKYYVNRVPLEEGLKYFGYTKDAILQFNKFLWMHAAFAFIIVFVKSINWKTKIIIISFGLFSFLTIVPGYYFYGHYWLQLLPGLAILAGATFYAIQQFVKNKLNIQTPIVTYVYLALFTIICYTHLNKYKNYYYKPNYEQIMRTTYGNNPFPETMEISKKLNTLMKPEDKIAVVGSEPELFVYLNKTSPTRHIFFSTIVADVPQHKDWQREFVKDVEAAKPKYIVYYNIPISLLVQANTDKYVFDWANKYIPENYNLIGLSDMPDGQRATYAWKEELNTYKPLSQNLIYIYEHK